MGETQLTKDEIYTRICRIVEPFNTKQVPLAPQTSFAADLEFDSISVMDLVAAIEDEFDIVLPLNRLPDLETVQEVTDEVEKIVKGG